MMMMTDERMAAEVMRRTRRARAAHKRTLVAAVAAGSLLCVTGVALALPHVTQGLEGGPLRYSASLMGAGAAGGYVLVGVLAFMLGTFTAWLGMRKGARDGHDDR